MPPSRRSYDRKFNASAECWSLFEEVIAAEFQNPVLFAQVHQLTMDAYAVQHAGGQHPDKPVCIHLVGLYLMLERGVTPMEVPPLQQRLARRSPCRLAADACAARAAVGSGGLAGLEPAPRRCT